jgi:hypothetical protein
LIAWASTPEGRASDREKAPKRRSRRVAATVHVRPVLLALAGHGQDSVLDFDRDLVALRPGRSARRTKASSRRITSIAGRHMPCG